MRLLIDGPLPGVANMARDEALLQGVSEGTSPATLRFYAWREPTISLGYFQDANEVTRQSAAVRRLPVVRRITGGGAILHDWEVTYSIAIPADCEWVRPNATLLYHRAHRAIIAAVGGGVRMMSCMELPGGGACGEVDAVGSVGESQRRGPFFCFARRHALDVVVVRPDGGTAKLAGSAQRRARRGVLQHGSIVLRSRYGEQPCATWAELGGPEEFAGAVDRLRGCFSDVLAVDLRLCEWGAGELSACDFLAERYGGLVAGGPIQVSDDKDRNIT